VTALSFLSDAARAEIEALIAAEVEHAVERKLAEREAHNPGSTSPYMTVAEAADYLRCRRQRVDDLLSSRRLTRHKDGSRTLVARREIEAYVMDDGGPVGGRSGGTMRVTMSSGRAPHPRPRPGTRKVSP